MFNMLTTQAKLLRDQKRSKWQALRDKFITEEDHKNYGPDYMEDSAKAWEKFKKEKGLNE